MTTDAEQQSAAPPSASWARPFVALATPVLWQWRASKRVLSPTTRQALLLVAVGLAVQILAAVVTVASQWRFGAGWIRAAEMFSPREVELVTVLVSLSLLGSVASTLWPGAEPAAVSASGARQAATVLAAAIALLPAAAGLYYAIPAQRLLDQTFVVAPAAMPSPLSTIAGTARATTTVPTRAAGNAMPAEPPGIEARFNVLLIGGDAGVDRWGLRSDSMNVVSVDRHSGDTVIIGVPRNLGGAPLPPGILGNWFPNGFDDLLNAMYSWGQANPDIVRRALGPTGEPGASLLASSIAEFTGLRIDGWVLVDMVGFIDVVDALGGVELYVTHEVPSPGNIPNAKHPTPEWYPIGLHHLDGTDALDYSRSRDADSDYERMARQRCVLANLAAQHGGPKLLRRWPSLASALSSTVRTNLSLSQMVGLIEQLRGSTSPARSLGLVPPDVAEIGWDAAEVRALVAAVLWGPPAPTEVGEASPNTTVSGEVIGDPSDEEVIAGNTDPDCVVLSG